MTNHPILKDKTVIVTGAGIGIGKAIALHLARKGAFVVATDIKEPAATASVIQDEGGEVLAMAADVTSADQIQAMMDATIKQRGKIDGLVNNAGIYSSIVPRPFEEIAIDDWRQLFEVNVF